MITTAYKFDANLSDVIRLTAEFKKAKLELAGLTKGTEEYSRKSKQIGNIQKQLKGSTDSLKKMRDSTDNLNKSGLNLVNTFKSAAVAIAAAFAFRAIVGGLKSIVTSFKDFEAQMAAVEAISGATSDQFKELEADALKYGKTTVFTATQVAKLQEEFARLGFTTDEIQNATKATLDLAAATGESLSNSAQIAGSTLRAFNMDASLTKEVTDTMAAAFTSSALNLERFTESMKFVAPVARATGFTLQETTAALANLADNGIKGSIAGNALKNIMLKLGDANSKVAKKVGGPVQGIDELAEAMEKLKKEGFGATEAVELLDKRSAPAFLALMQNIDGLKDSVQILNDAEGATQRMAAIRLNTLEGDMTLLTSATEGLSVALGEEFDVMLREIIYSLTNFIKSIANSEFALGAIKAALKSATVAMTFFLSKMAVSGLTSFVTGIGGAVTALLSYTTAAGRATASTTAFTTAIARNPLGALAVALTTAITAIALFKKETSEAEMQQRRFNDAIRDELSAIIELEEGSNKYSIALRDLAGSMEEYRDLVDLEMATETELAELRTLLIEQAEGKERLAVLKDEMMVAEEFLRVNEETYEAEIKSRQARLLNKKLTFETQQDITRQINDYKNLLSDNRQTFAAAKEEYDFIKDLHQKQFENTELWNNRRLKGDDIYRKKRKKFYEQELKDFRDIEKQKVQEAELRRQERMLQEMQWASDFVDITTAMGSSSGGALEDLEAKLQNLTTEMGGFDVQAFLATTTTQKLRVDLSLMKGFVNNLAGALKTGGTPEMEKFVKEAMKLRKTKDMAKEFFKVMVDGIDDMNTKERIELTAEYNIFRTELEKQSAELQANLLDIDDLIMNATSQRIEKTLKKNRNKFDILKNLSDQEFRMYQQHEIDTRNMSEEEKAKHLEWIGSTEYHGVLMGLLMDISQDEQENLNHAIAAKKQAQQNYQNDYVELVREGANAAAAEENQARQNRIVDLDAENAMEQVKQERHEFSLFSNYKQMRELRTEAVQAVLNEIKRLEEKAVKEQDDLLDQEIISEEEHAAAVLRIKSKAANDGVAVVNEGLDSEVDAQLQALNQIKDYYQRAFDAFSTYMSNRLELQKQAVEESYANETGALSDALEHQLELHKGNSDAQADIRKHYDLKQEALDAKRDQEMRKIARKQFIMQKANDIAMAVINGAVAITTVAKQTGVGAAIAAPIMSALVAAQIAAISAQQFVGAKGGVVPDDRFAHGGMVYGPSHAQGGVKFAVGGRVAELEGGEAVINKRSTAMFRSQLSAMNAAGGGVRFANGGITGALQSTATASSNMNLEDLAKNIVTGINNKTVTVTEAEITDTQQNVSIAELTSSIF